MKIAVLSSHTPSLFWFRLDMMKAFVSRGAEVYAIGNEDEEKWKKKFEKNNIVYRKISVSRNGTNPFNDLKTIRSIVHLFKEINPDKIFTYQAKTVIYGCIAAKLLKINDVYPLIAGIGSVFLKDDAKTRIIRKVMVSEYRCALKDIPMVFFQNHDDEQVFSNYRIVNHNTVILNGSGVNLELFKVQPFPEKTAFLCISRLIRDKGVYEYLEACKRIKSKYPDARCLLVGPFDTNPSSISQSEIENYTDKGIIEFFGEQENVIPFIAMSSVFVLPSYREGTPKTNLEAMACGRPVITTDAPGCRETVIDGENGFLVPVKDIDALCEKMETFILKPYIINDMGRKSRSIAEKKFDVNIVNNIICSKMGI